MALPLTVNYHVCGTATPNQDYPAIPGVAVIPAGLDRVSVTIHTGWDILLEGNETVVLTLDEAVQGYTIGSPWSANITILDYRDRGINPLPNPTQVVISAPDDQAVEEGVQDFGYFQQGGPHPGQFLFQREGDVTQNLTVWYSVSGTATSGLDYTPLPTSVVIPAGERAAVVTLNPLDDHLQEMGETVVATLLPGTGYTYSEDHTATAIVYIIDDEAGMDVTISATDDDASETGPDPGVFTFTRTGDTSVPLTVHYEISGSATPGSDYTSIKECATFPVGVDTITKTVIPVDDTQIEDDETVTIYIPRGPGYRAPGQSPFATVTIVDNDGEVTVEATDPYASETGGNLGQFTIKRSGNISDPLTINYRISGTATPVFDYQPLPINVTIPAGASSVTVAVSPVADLIREPNETVVLTLTNAQGRGIGEPSSAFVTIADGDGDGITTVTVEATDPSASENELDPGEFTITRIGDVSQSLIVNYFVRGTASPSFDYQAMSGSVTFPAGVTNVPIQVIPIDDFLRESTETVELVLTSGSNYSLGATWSDTVYIFDNDLGVGGGGGGTLDRVMISAVDPLAAESGPAPGLFVITRMGGTTNPLTVSLFVGGTAVQGVDYEPIQNTIEIPSGSHTAYISVLPIQDPYVEGTESVTVSLRPGPGYWFGPSWTAEVDIEDDDGVGTGTPVVSVEASDPDAAEQDYDPGFFTFYRRGELLSALTVSFQIGGTATLGEDYDSILGTVTFPSGSASVSIAVNPIDDSLPEGVESVEVTLSPGAGYQVDSAWTASLSILDNDGVDGNGSSMVTVAATDTDATETGVNPGVFTITRTGDISLPLVVKYALAGSATEGVDYAAQPGQVTIPAWASSSRVVVAPFNDSFYEGTETVKLVLQVGANYLLGNPWYATVFIRDDDTPGFPTVTIEATDTVAVENDGTNPNPGEFTVTRSGGILEVPLTVNLVVRGTAVQGQDYYGVPYSISFPAGEATITFHVAPIDDALPEGTETVVVSLAASPNNYILSTPNQASVLIFDNDVTVQFDSVSYSVAEGVGAASIRLVLDAPVADSVVVVTRSSDITARRGVDYGYYGEALTFAPGKTSVIFTIPIFQDLESELSESFQLRLLEVSGAILGERNTTEVLIRDDDATLITVEAIHQMALEVGQVPGSFMVYRRGDSSSEASVSYSLDGSTATPEVDYSESLGGIVTLPAGADRVLLTVTPVDDQLLEGWETVSLNLRPSFAYAVGAEDNATVWIEDDEASGNGAGVVVTVAATDPWAAETGPNPGAFTLYRTGDLSGPLTVAYSLSGTASSTDYIEDLFGTITIPSGLFHLTIPVTPADDSLSEGIESLVFSLISDPNYSLLGHSEATVAIDDNETPMVTVQAIDGGMWENPDSNNTGIFRITRTQNIDEPLTVDYSMTGSAVPGSDYVLLSGSITIPAGQSFADIVVFPLDDAERELRETVILTLLDRLAYNIGIPADATITILDDDTECLSLVTINVVDNVATEGSTMDVIRFRIIRHEVTDRALVVTFLPSGSATPQVDYTGLPNYEPSTEKAWAIIPGGQSYVDVVLTPMPDELPERVEWVALTLAPDPAYGVGYPGLESSVIYDDLPNVSLSILDGQATEGHSDDTGVIRVSRTGSTSLPLTVHYLLGGTATPNIDYIGLPNYDPLREKKQSITIPSGQSYVDIAITALEDNLYEGGEKILFTIDYNVDYFINWLSYYDSVFIRDNDTIVIVYPQDADATERPIPDPATFVISRTGEIGSSLRVEYSMGGYATPNIDYTGLPNFDQTTGKGWVLIPAGQSEYSIVINPIDDILADAENVTISILPPNSSSDQMYYLGGLETAAAIIWDDEPTVTLTREVERAIENSTSDSIRMRISRSGATSNPLTVFYSVEGSATPLVDYTGLPNYDPQTRTGHVTIPSEQTYTQIILPPIDDAIVEGTEDIGIKITHNSYYYIRDGSNYYNYFHIIDDEPGVTLTVPDGRASENPTTDTASVLFGRTGATNTPLTVYYYVEGEATPLVDYTGLPNYNPQTRIGHVSFSSGQEYSEVVLTAIEDDLIEAEEGIRISIMINPEYYILHSAIWPKGFSGNYFSYLKTNNEIYFPQLVLGEPIC